VLSLQQIVDNYTLFPERFGRDASGTLVAVDQRWVNSGDTVTEGVEVSLRSGFNAMGARWTAGLDGTYLLRKKSRVVSSVPNSAAESVIGTVHQFFWPLPGRSGAAPMRAIPGDSREAKIARLSAGEAELLAIAARTKDRTDWKYHLGNVALNAAGAGAIFHYGHDSDAWEALGIGIAIGEISIWTAPTRGSQDLEDYQTHFEMKTASRVQWSIVPMMGGAGIRVTF